MAGESLCSSRRGLDPFCHMPHSNCEAGFRSVKPPESLIKPGPVVPRDPGPALTVSTWDPRSALIPQPALLSARFAKYYRDLAGNEQRTLTKAYGIRFDIIVFGKVGPPVEPAWRASLPLPSSLSAPPSEHWLSSCLTGWEV